MFPRTAVAIVLVVYLLSPTPARPADKSQSGSGSGPTVPQATRVTQSQTCGAGAAIDVSNDLGRWAQYYNNNQWKQLQKAIIAKLDGTSFAGACSSTIDFSASYYIVIFPGPGPLSDNDLIAVVVHTDNQGVTDVKPYSTTLPGINKIVQLYINKSSSVDLTSYCLSTLIPNPLLTQTTKAAQAFKPPGASKSDAMLAQFILETQELREQPDHHQLSADKYYLHLSTIDLPISRSSISVQSREQSGPSKAQFSLTNAPLVGYSLASIAGGVFEPGRRNRQYKLQAGTLTASPLSASTVIIGLDWFPWGKTNDMTSLTMRQRFRIVPGIAVAPTLAPSLGGAFLLVDGFSLNVGVAWFRVNTLTPGEKPNTPPAPNTRALRLGWERLTYVGFGYNFN